MLFEATINLLLCCLLFLLFSLQVSGQSVSSRIEADFTIKEKDANGKLGLTKGTVYYDKDIKKLVYKVVFPGKEVVVFSDTLVYRTVNGKYSSKRASGMAVKFSIFHLALNHNLQYFGLNASKYEMVDIRKENGLTVSTWLPEKEYREYMGKIVLSQKDNKLDGLISYGPDGTVIAKQFFRNYTKSGLIEFPQNVYEFNYLQGVETKKTMEYSNIVLDKQENEEYYNYPVTINNN